MSLRKTLIPLLGVLVLFPALNSCYAEDKLKQRRDKLETQIHKFIEKIKDVSAKSKSKRMALINFRPEKQSNENDEAARQITSAFEKQFLLKGLLVRSFELDHKFAVSYKNNRLPKRWFNKSHLKSVSEADYGTMLTGTVSSSRNKHKLKLSLIDLETNKYLLKSVKLTVDAKGVELKELLKFSELPAMNSVILRYGIKMLGKKVDRGECWDLPAIPMKENGVRIHTYTFGETVSWDKALPGDVITFGDDGKTGGHVIVLLRHAPSYSRSLILHQNWGKRRYIMVDDLAAVIAGKRGQKMRVQRPRPKQD